MAQLPSWSQIPILLDSVLCSVVACYLDRLESDPRDGKAKRFIVKALKWQIEQKTKHRANEKETANNILKTLRFVPHVFKEIPGDQYAAFEQWTRTHQIDFEHFRLDGKGVFVFSTWENALLFKLRW